MITATIQAFNFKLRQRGREKLEDLIKNRREILIAQLCVGFPSSGKEAKEKALCTQCTCEIPLIRLMCQSLASFFLFPKLSLLKISSQEIAYGAGSVSCDRFSTATVLS
jgi:hypothetical protein